MICNLGQKNMDNGISKRIVTNKMAALWHKRERQINGYIAQTVGLLFKKVKEFDIDTIVVGYNAGWKQNSHMGKKNNQKFVQIPFQKLIAAIENKCVKKAFAFSNKKKAILQKLVFLIRIRFQFGLRMIRRNIALAANELRVVCIKVKQEHVSMLILMVR